MKDRVEKYKRPEGYRTIAQELLSYESSVANSEIAFRNFREGVVFVSLPVLESYLDDVLDPKCSEDYLLLESSQQSQILRFLCIVLSFFSMAIIASGILFKSIPLFMGFAVLFFSGLCAYYLCFLSPRSRLIRRMNFAKVLSREISRRRGIDGNGRRPMFNFLENWVGSGKLVGYTN